MADDLLDRLLAPPAQGGDPLDATVQEEVRRRAAAAVMTSSGSPDVAGKANVLARQAGLPADLVQRNLPEFERQSGAAQLSALTQRYPAIGHFASDPRNAAVIGPDLDAMGHSSKLWNQALTAPPSMLSAAPAGDASYLGASWRSGLRNVAGVAESAASSGADLQNAVQQIPLGGDFLGAVIGLLDHTPLGKYINAPKMVLRDAADRQFAAGQAEFARLAPDQQKFADLKYATTDPSKAAYLSGTRILGDVINSAPTTAALALTAYLTRGASIRAEAAALAAGMTEAEASAIAIKAAALTAARVGAVSEGAVGYHQQKLHTRAQILAMPFDQLEAVPAYQHLITAGDSPAIAREKLAEDAGEKAGSIAGIVDAVTNLISGPVLGRIIGGGGSLAPRVAKGFATEAAQEAVQSPGEQFGGNLAVREIDPDQALLEGLLESTLQGFVVGGFTGGPMAAAFGRAHSAQVQAARDQITGDALHHAMDAAADNSVRKRDAEAFRQFVELHTKDSPIEHMFVPAEKVATYFQSQESDYHEDPFWSRYADQIDEGLTTGGDVVIPTADAAAHIAGTPAWEALSPDVRTSPGGSSVSEAKALQENHAAEMDKLGAAIAEKDIEGDKSAEASRRNYQDIRDKLTNAGFTQDAAHLNASLIMQRYATRAERMGVELKGDETSDLQIIKSDGKPSDLKDGPLLLRALSQKGNDKSIIAQALVDGAGLGAKDLGDIAESVAGLSQSDRLKSVPSLSGMLANMRSAIADDAKVLDAIVSLVPIKVVNDLFGSKAAAKVALHNEAMLKNGTALDGNLSVAGGSDATQAVRLLSVEIARMAAKIGRVSFGTRGEAIKGNPAASATVDGLGTHFDFPRAQLQFTSDLSTRIITLFEASNLSSLVHETGHLWLEELKADATRDGAADAVKADWQTVQDWFGANGHKVVDGAVPVEAHELFARGFERFVMEGKSPSSTLRRVFDAFRSWLLNIYQVVDNLNAPITPEIRDVMNRLVATDEEIALTEQKQGITLGFDQAQLGMSDAEYAAHQALASEAKNEAHDALLFRTMKALRDARTKAWKDEEKGVRAEVTSRVDRRPEFKALDLLRTGRMVDDADAVPIKVKLDRASLVETYGEGILAMLPKGVYADKGVHADEIAERVGFSTGDTMIRTLAALEERKREMVAANDRRSVRQSIIDAETQAEMRDRHGDPLNDGSIEQDALAAVQNDKQGEVIASELRALSRRSGARPTPYSLAKEWARAKIASGIVSETTSGSAIQRYARAAAKAAKEAEAAILKGDAAEAFRHKQAQMLNNALIAEAGRVREKVEIAVSRLGRYAKRRTMASMDQDYLEQIHGLLEQVEFRNRSQSSIDRQESFEDWARAREAEGHDIVVPASFAASLGTTNWSRLTNEKLLGLDDTVKQIAHLGRLKQKLIDGKDERDFADMVNEGLSSTDGMKHKPPVSGFLDPSQPARLRSFILGIDAAMLKMETVFGWLDQGKPNGFYTRVIFQRFVDAQNNRRLRLKEMKAKLDEIRTRVPNAVRKTWGDKVELGLIDPTTGLPAVMTRDQLIMMALNLGNESSAWKLARGYGWNEQAILREIGVHLKPEEWTMVQELWDQIGTLWPDIAALERRVNGVEPEKVEARAVQTPHGELRGGYFPAVYDPTRNLEVEKRASDNSDDLFSAGYRRATTRAGATNERTGFYAPILLSFSVIDRHVGEVIHDITHREVVMDANRFLNDKRIVTDIRETLGVEIQKQIQPWLRHIANEWASDASGTAALEKFFKNLRTNATFVGIGFRVSTILTQSAGLFNTAEAVGARWVASGIGRFAQHPIETTRMVLATSKEVAGRMETLDRDINDSIKAEMSRFGFISEAKLFAFKLIGYADRFVSVISWVGGYNRGLSEGMSEEQAVAYADKIVRQSQSAGAAKDLAAIQRGKGAAGEASKLLTMFYAYMSGFYQRQRTLGRDYNQAIRTSSVSDMPGLLARTMWLYFFPALAAELIGKGIPDCEDSECWTKWAGKTIGMSALGPIPVVRDIAGGLASGFGYNFTPASGMGRTVVAVGQDIYRLWEGDETKHATKDAMEASGYLTGAVPGQLATATQFLVDVGQGDQHPETFGEWYNGMTKGKTDPKARH